MDHLLTIILLFYSLNEVASEEYYIRAYATDICAHSCLTLSQFVARSYLLTSNIKLVFNPGRHHLDVGLTVSNLRNISMTSRQTTAEIRCTRYSQITFSHSQNIHITNLEFVGCGGNKVVNVDKFVVRNSTFRGQENSGTALELIATTAQIINCIFSSNTNGKFQYISSYYGSYSRRVGGAIIANHSNVNISQSIFENNGVSYHLDYGAAIFAEQQSIININSSTFINNSALFGMFYSKSCSIRIEANEFSNNNARYEGVLTSYSSNATIQRSIFENNIRCALYFDGSTVKIKSNEFRNNSVDFNGALAFKGGSIATVEQNLFQGNNGSAISSDRSTITIKTMNFMIILVMVDYLEHKAALRVRIKVGCFDAICVSFCDTPMPW